MKTLEIPCHCQQCNEHFNVKIIVKDQYDSCLIRYCPLCGQDNPTNIDLRKDVL